MTSNVIIILACEFCAGTPCDFEAFYKGFPYLSTVAIVDEWTKGPALCYVRVSMQVALSRVHLYFAGAVLQEFRENANKFSKELVLTLLADDKVKAQFEALVVRDTFRCVFTSHAKLCSSLVAQVVVSVKMTITPLVVHSSRAIMNVIMFWVPRMGELKSFDPWEVILEA